MPPYPDPDFWRGRAVLVTGHTGFKGAWLTLWLQVLGARVSGFADAVPTRPSLYELARVGTGVEEFRGDIRDSGAVRDAIEACAPEVVVHMAAQPFVRRSFADPHATFETNVMGTVNVLEAARSAPSVRVVVNVTSDKCYDNDASRAPRPFVESDPMGGHDPYSSSKGCAELVIDAYRRSFFSGAAAADVARVASARAGNVIGGGDWGEDRLIPDFMRGALAGEPIAVRNPEAVRPWQHVLNPLSGYLRLVEALWEGTVPHGEGWNFGPDPGDALPVRDVVERLRSRWPDPLEVVEADDAAGESTWLALDSAKARERLGWRPGWDLDAGLDATVEWFDAHRRGEDLTLEQIRRFAG